MGRYVQINENSFREMVETQMGFTLVPLTGVNEKVWQRPIPNTSFAVRIFSTIELGISRNCGEDAIRICLVNTANDRILKSERTYRTLNALTNMRDRAREVWSYTKKNMCECGCGVMIERKGKVGSFMGCSNYPTCRNTKPI